MKNWYLLLISLMAALVLFMMLSFFYGKSDKQSLTLNGPIQVILKSMEGQPMDFWDVVNSGIEEASKEFGVQVEISGPRFEREINRQITIMNRVIETEPPLIILAASDYVRLVDSIKSADNRGIPIITLDSGVDSDVPVSFIATNNIDAGYKAGLEMKRLIETNNRKDIAIVSHIKETATAIDREAGVRRALDTENIIGTWFIDVDQEKAYIITLDLLKNENLGGIVALNEVAALGVARAIDEQNAQDQVLVVGFDNAVRELAYLEEGIIKATVVQRPYNMGYFVIKTAVEYLQGENVKSFIDTGSILITRDNMFQREYQELLFPFSQ
ncbi:MAG: substrate-binding domain-containing protein [Spirochaetaceae bacterium]|jgi:ribose transport system substrate-binding protein|nr:substrate-binding domain-containing protein [Spirochaetaceae bacterium]